MRFTLTIILLINSIVQTVNNFGKERECLDHDLFHQILEIGDENVLFLNLNISQESNLRRLSRLEETLNVLMAQIYLLRKSGVKIILTLQEISPLGVLLEVYDEIQKDNSLDLKIEHITDDPNGTNSVLFHSPDIWVGQYPTCDNTSIALSKKKGIRQNNRYFVRIDGIIFTLFNVHTAYYEGKKAIDFLLKKLCLSEWNKDDYFVIVGDMNINMTEQEKETVSKNLRKIGVTIDFVITPEDKLELTTTNATYDVFITNIRKRTSSETLQGAFFIPDKSIIWFRENGKELWIEARVQDDKYYPHPKKDPKMIHHYTLTNAGEIIFGILPDNTCSKTMKHEVSFEQPKGIIDRTIMMRD